MIFIPLDQTQGKPATGQLLYLPNAASVRHDPSAVRRLLNISGQFSPLGKSFLNGPLRQWAEDLAGLTLEYGVSGFILAADDANFIEILVSEVVPTSWSSRKMLHRQHSFRTKAEMCIHQYGPHHQL